MGLQSPEELVAEEVAAAMAAAAVGVVVSTFVCFLSCPCNGRYQVPTGGTIEAFTLATHCG